MTRINTPTDGNDKFDSILEQWNELSDKEQSELLKMLQQNKKDNNGKEKTKGDIVTQEDLKKDKGLEDLKGDRDRILDYLKENHVKIEKNAEVVGHKGKKVHINLPKVGNFEGFKFDYFVSNASVRKGDFEEKPALEKESYSMNDVSKFLKAMNEFMAALGCETDGNMEYESELKSWKTRKYRCDAGDCLKTITGGNSEYWLSDKNVAGIEDSRTEWRCHDDYCFFASLGFVNDRANLFLRLSD